MNKFDLFDIFIIILILYTLLRNHVLAKWYLHKLEKKDDVDINRYKCCNNCKYYEGLVNHCKYCGYIYHENDHICDKFEFSLEWLRSTNSKRTMNNFRDRTKAEGD